MEIFKEFQIEAAHRLPNVPSDHKCARPHGHSYRIEVHLRGEVDPRQGWIMDFARIGERFEPIRRQLDHRLLNEVEGLENPTSEILACWVWDRLKPELPELVRLVVRETRTSGCVYEGPGQDEGR